MASMLDSFVLTTRQIGDVSYDEFVAMIDLFRESLLPTVVEFGWDDPWQARFVIENVDSTFIESVESMDDMWRAMKSHREMGIVRRPNSDQYILTIWVNDAARG